MNKDERKSQGYTSFAPAVGITVVTAAFLSGREPAEICAQIGVSPEQIFDPNHRFHHSVVSRSWTELGSLYEDFGFYAAQLIGARPQSLVEYATSNASNGRESFQIYLRYQR